MTTKDPNFDLKNKKEHVTRKFGKVIAVGLEKISKKRSRQ